MEYVLVVIEKLNGRSLRWIKKNHQQNWRIFCLNKADRSLVDFGSRCEVVDLAPCFFDLTETSLGLLESELDRIHPIARELFSIFKLDISAALHRYLLSNYYIKKARIEKIRSLYDLNGCHAMYVDGDYVIYDGFLHILSLHCRWSKYRSIGGLFCMKLRSLRNISRFSRRRTDILFLLPPLGIRSLSGLLRLMSVSGMSFAVVDKSYLDPPRFRSLSGFLRLMSASGTNSEVVDKSSEDALYNQNINHFCDKLYAYSTHIVSDYIRYLSSPNIHKAFFSDFVYYVLLNKYMTKNLCKQFQFRIAFLQNEYDTFQSVAYHQLKENGAVVLDYMHGEKMYMLRDALPEYDHLLVWGGYYRDLFEKLKHRAKKITVVGNVAYDRIGDHEVANAELLKVRSFHRKIISVYPQPTYGLASVEWQTQMMIDVCSYVKDRSDVFVFVKHHPNEFNYPTPDYDEIVGDLPNIERCYEEYELHDLIAVSDLILTPYSTVGLEAILLRKNVMYLNYGAVEHLVPYAVEGSAIEINDSAEFEYYVDGLLNGTIELEKQKTIDRHANGLDGQAAQHIYDEIVKYL